MHNLNALKVAHAAKPLKAPVAVFVGGTAGIGAAMALKIAKYSSKPEIHLVGRNRSSADKVIAELKAANSAGSYHFHPCDVSLLSNARTLASTLSQSLPKVNILVLSAGILSMNGRTETTEGHDVKMVLHYYSRMLFIQALAENLKAATDAGEDARVMTVLDSVRGDYTKMNWDDLELKKGFSLSAAASHCMAMSDVSVQRFARLYPAASFQHSYPALVATDLHRSLPWYASGTVNILAKTFGTSAGDCAEYFFDALWNDTMKTGAHFVDAKGKEFKNKLQSSSEIQDKVWAHTESIIGKL
ncbi:hypothetical protein ONZ45_g12457 [Pleurotus djamor]|nr:hypothetical protein ONZ45_g12457 [Pleurotus djamor]